MMRMIAGTGPVLQQAAETRQAGLHSAQQPGRCCPVCVRRMLTSERLWSRMQRQRRSRRWSLTSTDPSWTPSRCVAGEGTKNCSQLPCHWHSHRSRRGHLLWLQPSKKGGAVRNSEQGKKLGLSSQLPWLSGLRRNVVSYSAPCNASILSCLLLGHTLSTRRSPTRCTSSPLGSRCCTWAHTSCSAQAQSRPASWCCPRPPALS